MLSWLFGSSRSDRARNIFHFWDGQQERRADPMRVWSRFLVHPTFENEVHPARAQLPGKDGAEALLVVVDAVRDAFKIPAFEDGGLTDQECYDLFNRFGVWLAALKKNGSPSPTLPPSTVRRPCPNCPPQQTSTNGSSDSGKTQPAA